MHGLKYLTLVTPNGLIAAAYGPCDGRRHDSYLLHQSGWGALFFTTMTWGGISYCVSGDSGFPKTHHLLVPWNRLRRVVVEWAYAMVCQLFQTVDFQRYNHILWTRPGAMYQTDVILMNMRGAFFGDHRIAMLIS
jgi:hypothetical protein